MVAFSILVALAFLFGPWIALIVVNRGRKREQEIANERWLQISRRVSVSPQPPQPLHDSARLSAV
jgi:hypothetical protein